MAKEGEKKPRSPFISEEVNLVEHLNQYSYMGFAGSTGNNYAEINSVLQWDLIVEELPKQKDYTWVLVLEMVVGGLAGMTILSVVAYKLLGWLNKEEEKKDMTLGERLKSLPGTPREFTYKVLKRATNDFDQMQMVGHGSYGVVYKGILQEENMEVAVKMFYRTVVKSRNSFLSEISIISRLRHKHLVPLIGWCHYEGMLFLVFQFMPNGSLDDHLCSQRKLSWDRRYKIVTGIASALHYLHEEYDQKVLHRDLKPSNVMLDSNFEARLGDFGLSKVLENGENSYAGNGGISGTIGYIAPECYFNGQATQETDVYAFGALVLEVVSGRHPCCVIADFDTLVDWVWKHYKDDCLNEAIDKSLGDEYVIEEANCLLVLGLACCNPIPSERPKTQAIVQIISKLIPPPYVPPEKPLNQMEQLEMGLKSMTDIPMVATLNSLYCASDHRSQQREIHEYVGAESSCNCIH
ncbi:probable L-type lectin-domain containing receptor kinase S.5 isoform X2 [Macadamia integrifolia]|nr:probable L-type lectin-domain containing receptor kinase S.5 isoform X2 [Macadamia integrifolia]